MKYNATVYHRDAEGKIISTFVAEVIEHNRVYVILRSNAIQYTGLEGSPRYHNYIHRALLHDGESLRVVKDNCGGYRNALRRLALPPAYQV